MSDYTYIARDKCGCCVALVVDYGDKDTAKDVETFMKKGLSVERVANSFLKDVVFKENGFLKCFHGQMELF